jgi:hypothetical protein
MSSSYINLTEDHSVDLPYLCYTRTKLNISTLIIKVYFI